MYLLAQMSFVRTSPGGMFPIYEKNSATLAVSNGVVVDMHVADPQAPFERIAKRKFAASDFASRSESLARPYSSGSGPAWTLKTQEHVLVRD